MIKFSIVITYLKEGSPEVLESINKMDYPKNYEILCLPGPGSPSIYRNKGADIGKGEIIAFIDDDAMVHKDLLKNAEKFFNEHSDIDIVGGPQLTPLAEEGFARISGYSLASKFGGWSTSNRYGIKKLNLNADDTYLTTAIMFCRKKVFEKVRFDENLFPGEDSKFVIEAKKAGFKVAYSPDMIVYHKRRPTLKKFVKQIFNYGKVAQTRLSFFDIFKQPFFFIPSLFLIYSIELFFIAVMKPSIFANFFGILFGDFKFSAIIFAPLLLYISLNLLFSSYESIKNKDARGIFFLPFIFTILHLSYGAGLIWGFMIKKFKKE
ncbi:MAG: glycosyltransferase [Candidatus Pacearchaeota archaeon]|nr:glycosyltransferase [Candidatus Pacearchaeota archaeon]